MRGIRRTLRSHLRSGVRECLALGEASQFRTDLDIAPVPSRSPRIGGSEWERIRQRCLSGADLGVRRHS